MSNTDFPVIDLTATGRNIRRLRVERGLTVKELQSYFGFQEPRAIYKWQRGECLPSVDNLYALGTLLGVPMDRILVPVPVPITVHTNKEQQAAACCCCFYRVFCCGARPLRLRQGSVTQLPPFFRGVRRLRARHAPAGRAGGVDQTGSIPNCFPVRDGDVMRIGSGWGLLRKNG